MTEAKGPGGRPSKYSEAYCNEVIDCMARGLSLTAFAGEIGVSRETVYEWQREHPEFSDAVKRAKPKRVLFLEQRLLDGETGPRVTSHIFALKNADPEEWRDKVQNEHTGLNGGPIEVSNLSAEDRKARLDELIAKRGG